MDKTVNHCIWLTFNSLQLEEIINDLSAKYGGPVFQSHCTLLGKTDIPPLRLKSTLMFVIEKVKIKNVTFRNIGYSQDFWQSYYIEISEEKEVVNLHKSIVEHLDFIPNCDFLPHISLMYNSVSEVKKREITLPIEIGFEIPIRSIQITECRQDVNLWKPIFELMIT